VLVALPLAAARRHQRQRYVRGRERAGVAARACLVQRPAGQLLGVIDLALAPQRGAQARRDHRVVRAERRRVVRGGQGRSGRGRVPAQVQQQAVPPGDARRQRLRADRALHPGEQVDGRVPLAD
jgi:hypothetical protein